MTFPITADDILAVVYSRQVRSYFMNTMPRTPPLNVEALLRAIDERSVCAVMVFEPASGKPTNITEFCARQYLYARETAGVGIKVQDAHDFPLYVRSSIAWANWKDDLEAEARATAPEVAYA